MSDKSDGFHTHFVIWWVLMSAALYSCMAESRQRLDSEKVHELENDVRVLKAEMRRR